MKHCSYISLIVSFGFFNCETVTYVRGTLGEVNWISLEVDKPSDTIFMYVCVYYAYL